VLTTINASAYDVPMKLKQWRKRKRLSQVDLAKALGVSRFSVIKWESGDAPRLDVARKIVDLSAGDVAFGDLVRE